MQSAYPNYQNLQFPAQPIPSGGGGGYYSRAECDQQQVPPYFPPATYPLHDPGIFQDTSLPPYTYPQPLFHDDTAIYEANLYAATQQLAPNSVPAESAAHIHSPVPVSAYSTLFAHASHEYSTSSSSSIYSPQQPSSEPLSVTAEVAPYIIRLSPAPQLPPEKSVAEPQDCATPHDTLDEYDAPQTLFPTPSELLGNAAPKQLEAGTERHPDACMSAEPSIDSSPSHRPAEVETRTPQLKGKSKAKVPAVLQPAEAGKTENLRKSYFRSVADQVGFQPTDPDTITSHDKKRHYLECLEQYILWLHEQIKLKGLVAQNMQRIESYNGLDSRSIRTLLVHMQGNTRKLHAQVVSDEDTYFTTEKHLFPHGEPAMEIEFPTPGIHSTTPDRARRHSIANGMIPMSAASHAPPSLPTSAPTSEAMATDGHA